MPYDYDPVKFAQTQVAALHAATQDAKVKRDAAVVALAGEGAVLAEIGRQIGLSEGAIRAIVRKASR